MKTSTLKIRKKASTNLGPIHNDDGTLAAEHTGTPGQSFVAPGIDHGPWLAKAGLGYTYSPSDGMNVSMRYNAGWRQDYVSQSLSLKAAWSF